MSNITRRHSLAQSSTPFSIENLEGRRMLSAAPASLGHHGALHINGTSHGDNIAIWMDSHHKNTLDVSVNGKAFAFRSSSVKSIRVDGNAGDDTITVADSVSTPSTLLGGLGDDTIMAGGGNDQVDGGAGNDHCDFGHHSGVAFGTVPTAVQSGLTTLAQGATVTTVQLFHEDGQIYYGTIVSIGGVDTRIVVDAAGSPVSSAPDDHPGEHGGGNHGGDNHGDHRGFGSFVSVDTTSTPNTITVSLNSEHGQAHQQTFALDPAVTVTADGATSSLASLPPGAWVAIKFSPTDANTAVAIQAFGKRVEGTVSAIDSAAMTITLAGEDGGPNQTYNAVTAAVTLDGITSTLDKITVGSDVHLKLAADGITVLAIESHGHHGGHGD